VRSQLRAEGGRFTKWIVRLKWWFFVGRLVGSS